jgi:hypothetical protein
MSSLIITSSPAPLHVCICVDWCAVLGLHAVCVDECGCGVHAPHGALLVGRIWQGLWSLVDLSNAGCCLWRLHTVECVRLEGGCIWAAAFKASPLR